MSIKRVSRFVTGMIAALLLLPASAPLIAHNGATGVIKERMDLMVAVGKEMKTMGALIKGGAPLDSEKISLEAALVIDIATRIEGLFPPGSLDHPSEAMPAVWSNWDQFTALNRRMSEEAKRLQVVAQGNDRRKTLRQFARLGKVCANCHDDFRKQEG